MAYVVVGGVGDPGPSRRSAIDTSSRSATWASSVWGAGACGSSESTSSTTAVATRRDRSSVVSISMPSRHGVVQAGSGLGAPSTRDQADAARAERRLAVVEAQRRHPRIGLRGCAEDGRALRDLELGAVDGDGDHASPSSSGKWASRLRIGAGIPLPWAHRLPSSSVSSSCSKLARVDRRVGGEHRRGRGAARSGRGSTCRSSRARRSAAGGRPARACRSGRRRRRIDAVADHAALGGQRVEVERGVELGGGQDPAQRAADLHRLDRRGRRAGRPRRPRTARAPSSRTAPRRRSG